MRVPVIFGCVAAALGLLAVGLVATPYVTGTGVPARLAGSPDPGPPTLLEPRPVALTEPGFHAWALLNTHTGAISGSDNLADTSDTVSMIKPWLAADFLREAARRRQTPTTDQLHMLTIMIRDSDNQAAEDTYRQDGSAASIERLISMCGLTDSSAVPDRWSETLMSPRDAVRMGACLADGRAAGPAWTGWLLNEMRQVRGDGRFGIVDALPDAAANKVAIKNGWLLRDETGLWHVNCLAVGDGWVLAVMMRYDGALGFAHGGTVCESVTSQLINPAMV